MTKYVAELQPPHDEPGPTDFLGIYEADGLKDAEQKVKEDWGLRTDYDGYTLRLLELAEKNRGRWNQRTVDLHDCRDNLTRVGAAISKDTGDTIEIPHICMKCDDEFTMIYTHKKTVSE